MDEHGNNVGGHQPTGEEEDENAGEVVEEASETVASSYSCLKPLTQLCVTGIICVACLCCCVCVAILLLHCCMQGKNDAKWI